MAGRILSDDQMSQLEAQGHAADVPLTPQDGKKRVLSDEAMNHLERAGIAFDHKAGPGTSAGDAALEHAGNAMTLGYLPHLQAMIEKLTPNPGRNVDAALKSQGFKVQGPSDSYVDLRDANIKRLQQEGKEHPTASTAGTVAGTVIGGIAMSPLFRASQAATVGSRLASAGLAGAGVGAVSNPGDVEGEVSPVQFDRRSVNAGVGGALGLGTQAALEVVAPVTQKAVDWLKSKASEKAVATLGANKSDLKRLGQKGTQSLGEAARENGVVRAFSTPGSVANKVQDLKEGVGQEIGDLIKRADAAGAPKVDGTKIGVDLLNDPEIVSAAKTPGMSGMVSAAQKEAETLAENGEMSLAQAHKLRQDVDRSINFNKRRPDLSPGSQEVLYKIRDSLNEHINTAVNGVEGVATDALKKANRVYSQLSRMDDIASNRVAMNGANRTLGLTDTIAASAGQVSGGPLAAVALTALNKGARTFGSSLQSSGYNLAANVFRKAPAIAAYGQNNPMLMQVLGQKLKGGATPFDQAQPLLNDPNILTIFKQNPHLIDAIKDPNLRAAMAARVGRKPATR